MTKYENLIETIGNTPLVKVNKLTSSKNLYAKVEFFNPAGSVKDRVAFAMLEEAEKQGLVNKDTTIITPSSPNSSLIIEKIKSV